MPSPPEPPPLSVNAPNVLLVGLGLHARRAHYPALLELRKRGVVGEIIVVDLAERRRAVEAYLDKQPCAPIECLYLAGEDRVPSAEHLERLDRAVSRHGVRAVVISTEPTSHLPYLRWALDHQLPVLVDKPVIAADGVTENLDRALGLAHDFRAALTHYAEARHGDPACQVTVVTPRRFHPLYLRVKELVAEVARATGCPVTSVTAEYGDGEWRMPHQIAEQTYHPLNTGYGMLTHSGYHALDTALWLAESDAGSGGPFDDIVATSAFSMPRDHLAQLPEEVTAAALGDAAAVQAAYADARRLDRPEHSFGEIDAHALLRLRRRGRTITTVGLHALHCSLTARAWVSNKGRNLYTGNGRIRQEVYSVQQGPFQSIKILCLQSTDPQGLYAVGGERHCEAHVFRNDLVRDEWRAYERIDLGDIEDADDHELAVGPGKAALMSSWLDASAAPGGVSPSDLRQHWVSAAALSAIYASHVRGAVTGLETGMPHRIDLRTPDA